MTTDLDSLLAAIHANPEDAAPRLALADHLEDRGMPAHAHAIRVAEQVRAGGRHADVGVPGLPFTVRNSGSIPWYRLRRGNAANGRSGAYWRFGDPLNHSVAGDIKEILDDNNDVIGHRVAITSFHRPTLFQSTGHEAGRAELTHAISTANPRLVRDLLAEAKPHVAGAGGSTGEYRRIAKDASERAAATPDHPDRYSRPRVSAARGGVGGPPRPRRYAATSIAESHEDYAPAGIAPRLGHVLRGISGEGNTTPALVAKHLLATGEHSHLPILGDALLDAGHPAANAFDWWHAPRGIAVDKALYPIVRARRNSDAGNAAIPLAPGHVLDDMRKGLTRRGGLSPRSAVAAVRAVVPDANREDVVHSLLRLSDLSDMQYGWEHQQQGGTDASTPWPWEATPSRSSQRIDQRQLEILGLPPVDAHRYPETRKAARLRGRGRYGRVRGGVAPIRMAKTASVITYEQRTGQEPAPAGIIPTHEFPTDKGTHLMRPSIIARYSTEPSWHSPAWDAANSAWLSKFTPNPASIHRAHPAFLTPSGGIGRAYPPIQDLSLWGLPGDPYRLLGRSVRAGNRHAIPPLVATLRERGHPLGSDKLWSQLYRALPDRTPEETKSFADAILADTAHASRDPHTHEMIRRAAEASEPGDSAPYRAASDHMRDNDLWNYADMLDAEIANIVPALRQQIARNVRRKLQRDATGQAPRRYAATQPPTAPGDALARVQSATHQGYVHAVALALDRAGLRPHRVIAAIHDTPAGSRPSVVAAISRPAPTPGDALVAGAYHGLMSRSPAVTAFLAHPRGPDSLYHFAIPAPLDQARAALDGIGVQSRILRAARGRTLVTVYDRGGAIRGGVGGLAAAGGSPVYEQRGVGADIGGVDEAAGRAAYRKVLRSATVGAAS